MSSGPFCWLALHGMSPLYYIQPFTTDDYPWCLSFSAISNNVLVNIFATITLWNLSIYPISGEWYCRTIYITRSLISLGTARLFLERLYHRAGPQQFRMFPVFSSSPRVSISKVPVFNICKWSPGHQTLKDRLSKMKNTPKLQTSAYSKVKRQVIICTLYGLLLFVVLHWHPLFWLWEKNLGVRRKKYGLSHRAAGERDTWCAHGSMCTGGGGCGGRKTGWVRKVKRNKWYVVRKEDVFSLKHWLGVRVIKVEDDEGDLRWACVAAGKGAGGRTIGGPLLLPQGAEAISVDGTQHWRFNTSKEQ